MSPTASTDTPEPSLAALADWRPYEPPPAPFPNDWRSDVPSWLERVCDPDVVASTRASAWKWLALLARHAEGRVVLEARAALISALRDEALYQHLVTYAYIFLDTFRDSVDRSGLDLYNRALREEAEALLEAICLREDSDEGPSLRRQYLDLDVHVCRHGRIGPEAAVRHTTANLIWRDDHKRLLAHATPLDWWGKFALVSEVLATNHPETEARLRDTATMPLSRV